MPLNRHGISGGLGRGAKGAAAVAMRVFGPSAAGQTVALAAPLMTLGQKCDISAVGRVPQGTPGRSGELRVTAPVTIGTTFKADLGVVGMDA